MHPRREMEVVLPPSAVDNFPQGSLPVLSGVTTTDDREAQSLQVGLPVPMWWPRTEAINSTLGLQVD